MKHDPQSQLLLLQKRLKKDGEFFQLWPATITIEKESFKAVHFVRRIQGREDDPIEGFSCLGNVPTAYRHTLMVSFTYKNKPWHISSSMTGSKQSPFYVINTDNGWGRIGPEALEPLLYVSMKVFRQ